MPHRTPELAELVTPDVVKNILATLTNGYDHVIVDAGSVLDERTMLALESADTVVIPVYPGNPALKSVHSLLDFLNEAGTPGSKTVPVLNNAFAREILKPRDIEHALGTKIAFDLPYDPFLYLKAVNVGVPIVLGAADSPAVAQFVKLAGLGLRPGRIHAPTCRARTPPLARGLAPPHLIGEGTVPIESSAPRRIRSLIRGAAAEPGCVAGASPFSVLPCGTTWGQAPAGARAAR